MKFFIILMTCLFAQIHTIYAADNNKYLRAAGSHSIVLSVEHKPISYYQVSEMTIDNPNFTVVDSASCQFLEKQCMIHIDVAVEAADQVANVSYHLTDLLTGETSQENIMLETAPVMNHISSVNAYYDNNTEHYLLARGNQVTFNIEIVGGFPWIDADVSLSDNEAMQIIDHNCVGTINAHSSCQVTIEVSQATEAFYADLNIINSLPQKKTLEIKNGLLSQVTQLTTGMLKIDFIALQDIQNISLLGLNDDKWVINTEIANGCDISGNMSLNEAQNCSLYLSQHPAYRYFTTGLYQKEISIPTSIGDFLMEVNLEGEVAIPDKQTNHLFMYKINDYNLSFDREIPVSVPVGHILANPFGYLYITDTDNGDIYRYNLLHDNIEKIYSSAHGASSLVLRENVFVNNAHNLHIVYEDGTLLQLRENTDLATPEMSTYNLGNAENFYHISKRYGRNTLYLTKGDSGSDSLIQTINLTSPLDNTTSNELATNLEGNSAIFQTSSRVFAIDSSDTPFYKESGVVAQWTGGKSTNSLSALMKAIQLRYENPNGLEIVVALGTNAGIAHFHRNTTSPRLAKPYNPESDLGDTLAILPSDNGKVFAFSQSEITTALGLFNCAGSGCSHRNTYKTIDGFVLPNDANYQAMTIVQFLSATELRPVIN